MFLSKYYKTYKGKRYAYQAARISLGHGRHISIHLRKGLSLFETLASDIPRATAFFEREQAWEDKKRANSKGAYRNVLDGQRKSLIPKPIAEILNAAGWNRQGRRMLRGPRFFSLEAARVRYSLGDEKFRTQIGSPERLLELCLEARSKLKSANALGRKGVTFDSCLAEAISEQPAP